jgi:hypothetical protein
MVIRRSLYFTLLIAQALVPTQLTGCAGPMGMAYSAASTGSLAVTGQTPTEHMAGKLLDAKCSVWDSVVDLAYICEYNRDPATTYNRTAF